MTKTLGRVNYYDSPVMKTRKKIHSPVYIHGNSNFGETFVHPSHLPLSPSRL
jgi:hypothetical protein